MLTKAEQCVIYVLDDEELVRKGLARLLRASGYAPKLYASAGPFFADLLLETPACILLDITMPHMTGLQVHARLKELGVITPVIFISARDDDETRQRMHEIDACCFLRKPVEEQALLDAISWVTQPQQVAPPQPQERITDHFGTVAPRRQ